MTKMRPEQYRGVHMALRRVIRTVAVLGSVGLGGCETALRRDDLNSCGLAPSEAATELEEAPRDADQLRDIADANRVSRAPYAYHREFWLVITPETLVLCRSDQSPRDSWTGEWWRFKHDENGWELVTHEGWVRFG